MKALTLTQPWATLVAIGAKRVETRSWRTTYRGPIAIHAAKGFPEWAREVCREQPFELALWNAGYRMFDQLPVGAIVATGRLVDCWSTAQRLGGMTPGWVHDLSPQERAFGDFSPLRFGFLLEDVEPLPEPIPTRGALGLWEWRPEAVPV